MARNDSPFVELDPTEVHARLGRGEAVLVDVREPHEIAAERIQGAQAMPLSAFKPGALPQQELEKVVLTCLGGKRSAMALQLCREAGVPVRTHMRGGLSGWKAAGLPTTR